MDVTKWQEHADKIIQMLIGDSDASTRQQALMLLDALVDSASAAGVASLFSPMFIGANTTDGTFQWMREIYEKLGWSAKRAFKKEELFWPLYELFLRLYPERPMELPALMTIGNIKKIPSFLQRANSVETLVIVSPCEGLEGISQLQNATTVAFDMTDRELGILIESVGWDYRTMASQKDSLTIVLSDTDSAFVAEKGLVLIATGIFAQEFEPSILISEPHIQLTAIPFTDLTTELWGQKTPHDFVDFGMIRLRLSGDVTNTIAERVVAIHLVWNWDNMATWMQYHSQWDSRCILHNTLSGLHFPNLKVFTGILSDSEVELRIINVTSEILHQAPKLETIYVNSTCSVEFNGCWSSIHPLTNVITLGYERFVAFIFSQEMDKSLLERFTGVSSPADRFYNPELDFEPYANVPMVHLFDADKDLSFVKRFGGIKTFTIEQDVYTLRQRFAQYFTEDTNNYAEYANGCPAELTERMTMPKVSVSKGGCKAVSLKDLMFYQAAHVLYSTSDVLMMELREGVRDQSFLSFFTEWLNVTGMIRVRNYCLWITEGIVKMKTYRTWGQEYLNDKKLYGGILNLERVLFGLPQGVDTIFPLSMNSVRYNDASIPVLGLMGISNLKTLYVEIPVDIEDVTKLVNVEVLYLNNLGLKSLPDSIAQMVNLKELYLWGNELQELSSAVGKLKSLEVINISGNQFSDIPDVLLTLPNLKKICLRGGTSSVDRLKQQNSEFSNRLDSGEVIIVDGSMS